MAVGRKWVLIVGFIFLVLIRGVSEQNVGAQESTSGVTQRSLTYTVTSNSAQTASRDFFLPADCDNDICQINYTYKANFQNGGYVSVTDANGNELFKATGNGSFGGTVSLVIGKTYKINACGGASGSQTTTINGNASLTITYIERRKMGTDYVNYDVCFRHMGLSGGIHNQLYMYLPANAPQLGYIQEGPLGKFNGKNLNSLSDMVVRPYPIEVSYEYWAGWGSESHGIPYLKINRCNAQGTLGEQVVLQQFRDSSTTGTFTIAPNEGIHIELNSGHWLDGGFLVKTDVSHECGYRIKYKLDETPPNSPELNLSADPGVVKIDTQYYTKSHATLQWTNPGDNTTFWNDKNIGNAGAEGVSGYKLDVYRGNQLFASESLNENPAGNSYDLHLPEGEYILRMKAYDYDQNQSTASNPVRLIVDHSIVKVDIPKDAIDIHDNSLALSWKPVSDVSGIKEYQAALTEEPQAPTTPQITGITETNTVFSNLSVAKTYFAWVRAIDVVGNTGEWTMAGPINLSGEPIKITTFPKATVDSKNQPQYQVDLQISSLLDGKYVIERQAEGTSTRQAIADLTYSQLAKQGFRVIDNTGLVKHGRYSYFVYYQPLNASASGGSQINSCQTKTVVIPNIATDFSVSGPENLAATQSFTHTIEITPKTDCEGDNLKFKVWYRLNQGQARSSGSLQSGPVTVTFPSAGKWEWWVEVCEFSNNQFIARRYSSTSNVVFVRNSIAYKQDGTQVAKNQPRFESSAPGFGKAVLIEYKTNALPTNSFFASGVSDWLLSTASGNEATKESAAGGLFGGKIAKITITKGGAAENQIQFYKALGSVTKEQKIACQIRVRASSPTDSATFECMNDSLPSQSFGSQALDLTTEYQTFKFMAVATADSTARISLNLGNVASGTVIEVDYICCEIGRVQPTTPHDGVRSLENLKVPISGISTAAGTWEQLVYVSSSVKRKGVSLWNRIFAIPRADGSAGINVQHATGSSVWDLETYNDAGKGSWLPNPISDAVTKENQWYRFRVTWTSSEAKLQIYELLTGQKVAEQKIVNPKLPTAFASYAYVGSLDTNSFPETLHDDIRVSNIVRTDFPELSQPLPVDEYTVLKMNLDDSLEPEYCLPVPRVVDIQPGTVSGVSLPPIIVTTPGKQLQLEANVAISGQVVEFRWNPGDGGAEFTGEKPVYSYTKIGDYTLTVKVKDNAGKVYTSTAPVQVRNTSSGTVQTNETWSGTHIVVGEVLIDAGKIVTIQPGTVIYIQNGGCLKIEGILQASDSKGGILFQTEDNSIWQGIVISGSGSVNFSGVTVQNAKIGIACTGTGQVNLSNTTIQNCQTALHCFSGTIKADACNIKNNLVYGIKEDNGCNPVVTNCRFQDNGIHYYDELSYDLTVSQLNIGANSGNDF